MITYNLHHLNQEDMQKSDHPLCMTSFTYQADFEEKGDFYRQTTPPLVFYRKKQLDLSLSSLIIISKPYIDS